jgi:hypothetical protein
MSRLTSHKLVLSLEGARVILSCALLLCASLCAAQMPQNPSPMVEHTRKHPRLKEERPPGRRETLELGTLFLPAHLKQKSPAPLLVFFHGGTWLPEVAATRNRLAVISIQVGQGSGVYAKAFADPQRFLRLISEAETKTGLKFGPVTLGGWSAGNGATREILKTPESYARVDRVLEIDGMHASYVNGAPGPLESQIEPADLQVWLKLARDALTGKKTFLITHSEIFPGTYASTTETADWLLAQLGLERTPVVKWGPMGMQQLSEVRRGKFLLLGFAGNSAPDHVDQLQSLPELLKRLDRLSR